MTKPSPAVAFLAVVALIVAAGMLVAATAQSSDAAPAPASTASPLPRFRSDGWLLPDEPLLGFVEIPAGPFLMGSDRAKDPAAFDNERWPDRSTGQGTVEVPAFYIARYETTVGQFKAFVDATGFKVAQQTLAAPANHPVAHVSWPDALAYGRWLETTLKNSANTPRQLKERLDAGWRVSLPSEAEWEKAARGTDARIFPWGNLPLADRANFGRTGPAAVGSFTCLECAFGLADMSGNVWELTRSPYQPYPYDTADDLVNLAADALWVMRGGHFADTPAGVRAAIRGGADPGARRPFIGFRLAMSTF